jgi:hypothetical protein
VVRLQKTAEHVTDRLQCKVKDVTNTAILKQEEVRDFTITDIDMEATVDITGAMEDGTHMWALKIHTDTHMVIPTDIRMDTHHQLLGLQPA